jgi:hypothetical protein
MATQEDAMAEYRYRCLPEQARRQLRQLGRQFFEQVDLLWGSIPKRPALARAEFYVLLLSIFTQHADELKAKHVARTREKGRAMLQWGDLRESKTRPSRRRTLGGTARKGRR